MKSKFKYKLLTSLLVTSLTFQNLNAISKAQEAPKKSTLTKQVSLEQKVSASELFKLDILRSTSSFIKKHKSGTPFKEQIKKHGFQKTLEHNITERLYCIDLAQKYLKTQKPELISNKNYLTIAKKLGTESKKFDKSAVNPTAKKVLKTQAEIIKTNTLYYIKLLKNNLKTYPTINVEQSVNSLVKNTFSSKEYKEYHDKHCKAITAYYGSLKGTLGPFEWLFGRGILDKIKRNVLKDYEIYMVNLYPELSKNNKK